MAGKADLERIATDATTAPHGHYAQAIRHRGLVYVSGLLGNSLAEHVKASRGVVEQTRHCMDQLEAILDAAGTTLSRVVKMSVYVVDVDEWAAINAELARRYGEHRPARIVVPTGTPLRYGSEIEIDAIAAAD